MFTEKALYCLLQEMKLLKMGVWALPDQIQIALLIISNKIFFSSFYL